MFVFSCPALAAPELDAMLMRGTWRLLLFGNSVCWLGFIGLVNAKSSPDGFDLGGTGLIYDESRVLGGSMKDVVFGFGMTDGFD